MKLKDTIALFYVNTGNLHWQFSLKSAK